MKKLFALLLVIGISVNLHAQAPSGINYQAAARNSSGNILSNQAVSFRLSILQGSVSGPAVYSESHAVTTNSLGLVNLVIGRGTPESGSFSSISWGSGPYFLQTKIDTGSGSYLMMGVSEFVSVPYALYAQSSGDQLLPGRGITIANDSINSAWTNSGSDLSNNNTGNVGIGTVATDQKLEVGGAIKVSNSNVPAPGSIRYNTSGDFEGATASGWKSLTNSTVKYFEKNNFGMITSTERNTMVLSEDSLIVPESGFYLILYNGRGYNSGSSLIGGSDYDLEGCTGVINVTNNLNWVGQVYGMMYSPYQVNTTSNSYYQFVSQTFQVSTYANLNQGDVLKAGGVAFSTGAPTTSWSLAPYRIQLIKVN